MFLVTKKSLRLHWARRHHSVKVLIDHFDSLTTERTRSDNETRRIVVSRRVKSSRKKRRFFSAAFCYLPTRTTMIKNRSLILRYRKAGNREKKGNVQRCRLRVGMRADNKLSLKKIFDSLLRETWYSLRVKCSPLSLTSFEFIRFFIHNDIIFYAFLMTQIEINDRVASKSLVLLCLFWLRCILCLRMSFSDILILSIEENNWLRYSSFTVHVHECSDAHFRYLKSKKRYQNWRIYFKTNYKLTFFILMTRRFQCKYHHHGLKHRELLHIWLTICLTP